MTRRKRRAARAPINTAPCPTPEKPRYTAQQAALEAARGRDRGAPPLDTYPCVCGAVHLTRVKPLEQRIRAALANRP